MNPIERLKIRALALVPLSLASCGEQYESDGERLARTYCVVCHAFPEPQLLNKGTWEADVLPQMAPRLGVNRQSLFSDPPRNPHMMVLTRSASTEDWEKIVAYYVEQSPDSLPSQFLPAQPRLDPDRFEAGPFAPGLASSAVITLLHVDSARERIFAGEAGSNRLLIFNWDRDLLATHTIDSPPTDVIVQDEHLLVLESGILHPNDEPRGRLVQYDWAAGHDSLELEKVLIDSLLRPVFVERVDLDEDGLDDFLICEFGDNRGRLALYHYDGSTYERRVLDTSPGAIRFEIRDMTDDGHPDIVALFAQGDERIVVFENDGRGNFDAEPRVLARFPPVYGSMHFAMHDFNRDGRIDILHVNGDNFDFSRILKPYHGIRILENDGANDFEERYFFPVYGAARAEAVDFDEDGDLDILTTSNFADEQHPERGIMFLEATGPYEFIPHAFSIAAGNQWNLMAIADLNRDGWLDAVVGAMSLANIADDQRGWARRTAEAGGDALLYFENATSR